MQSPESQALRLVAAKAIIRDSKCRILVVQQVREKGVSNGGTWNVPGGICEHGETVKQALVRETKEETGLHVTVGTLVDYGEWQADIRGEHFYFVGMFYDCTLASTTITLDNTETINYKWIGRDDLDSIVLVEPARSIIKRALS